MIFAFSTAVFPVRLHTNRAQNDCQSGGKIGNTKYRSEEFINIRNVRPTPSTRSIVLLCLAIFMPTSSVLVRELSLVYFRFTIVGNFRS